MLKIETSKLALIAADKGQAIFVLFSDGDPAASYLAAGRPGEPAGLKSEPRSQRSPNTKQAGAPPLIRLLSQLQVAFGSPRSLASLLTLTVFVERSLPRDPLSTWR